MTAYRKLKRALLIVAAAMALVLFILFFGWCNQQRHAAVVESTQARLLEWEVPSFFESVLVSIGIELSQDQLRHFPLAHPKSVTISVIPDKVEEMCESLGQIGSIDSVFIFAENKPPPIVLFDALRKLPKLRSLDMSTANTLNINWRLVAELRGLEELYLTDNALTDQGLEAIQTLPKLRVLSLTGTKISEKSIPILASFTHLSELDISDTAIGESAIGTIKKALTKTKIVYEMSSDK